MDAALRGAELEKSMEAQFVVTVKGNWHYNFKPATVRTAEKMLREAVKEQFDFLADRASVSRADNRIYRVANTRAMTLDDINGLLHIANKNGDAAWFLKQVQKALDFHKERMAELPGKNPSI